MKKIVHTTLICVCCLFLFAPQPLLLSNEIISGEHQEIIFEDVNVAGTYPVIVKHYAQDGTLTEEIFYVTVTYLRTVVSEYYQEAIDAHDIKVQKELFEVLTDRDLIRLAKAHAWNTKNGEAIEITTVDKRKAGAGYEVTFSTANQTSTTIHVIEEEKIREEIIVDSMYIEFDSMPFFSYLQFAVVFLLLAPIILFYFNYMRSKKKMEEIERLLYENLGRQ